MIYKMMTPYDFYGATTYIKSLPLSLPNASLYIMPFTIYITCIALKYKNVGTFPCHCSPLKPVNGSTVYTSPWLSILDNKKLPTYTLKYWNRDNEIVWCLRIYCTIILTTFIKSSKGNFYLIIYTPGSSDFSDVIIIVSFVDTICFSVIHRVV